MPPKSSQKQLNGPEVIDIDPQTGQIFGDDVDTADLENDQDKLLNDIVGEFGASDDEVSYSASVSRIPKNYQKGMNEPWLFECDAADIIGIRARLRDGYGGGRFRIRVYKTTGRGKRLHRQMDYFIEPPLQAAPNPTGDAKYDALSGALERTQQQLLALADRLATPTAIAAPQADPFQMMERMSTIMKNMMPAHVERPQDNSFTMKDGLELFQKGMEIQADMRGDGGDSWISVFKELVKGLPIADVLKNLSEMQARQNPNMRRQLPQPQPQLNGNPPNQQHAPMPQSPMNNGQQLEQSMRYLIGKARANADPSLYAEWLMDNSDKGLIAQMANDPNVLMQLGMIFPVLNQPAIHQWFVELVENIKQYLAENPANADNGPGIANADMMNGQNARPASDLAPDTGRDPWDQGNPQDHARVGENGPA